MMPLETRLPSTWFTAERMAEFWNTVKWFLVYNMPIFMICIAAVVVFIVLTMIVDAPLEARDEQRGSGRRRNIDDDDVEVKYY